MYEDFMEYENGLLERGTCFMAEHTLEDMI